RAGHHAPGALAGVATRLGGTDAAGPGSGGCLAAAPAVRRLLAGIAPAAASTLVGHGRPAGRAPARPGARPPGATATAYLHTARDVPPASRETPVTTATVDMAGGPIGGAARFRAEVRGYLERSAR